MRSVEFETITSWKVPKPIRHRERPLARLLRQSRRASLLLHLARWLLHQPLAPQAAVAAALLPAGAPLPARPQRPPRLRRTLQLRPLEAGVEAAARTETILFSETCKEKRLLKWEPFFFSWNIGWPATTRTLLGKNHSGVTHDRCKVPGNIS